MGGVEATHEFRARRSLWEACPRAAEPLLRKFADAFTRPTHRRFVVLLFAAILTAGRRTVSNLLRTAGALASGHPSSCRRVFSRRRWSSWRLARALADFMLNRWIPEGPVYVCGDDTVDEHRGKKVYGKACHRDAVRSTHSFTACRRGHKWVVLCLLVEFPFSKRSWALPMMVALYRSREWNEAHGRRHKTPSELMRQMLAALIRWFPRRKFVSAGDGGYGTHELARFAHRHRLRLTLVSRFYPDANLYAAPPKPRGKKKGRPRTKGRKLASPHDVVKQASRSRLTVAWYGGGTRRIEVVTGVGQWYKNGEGLVPVRWVYVHDLDGTHRDDYFFTTDVDMTPKSIVETFTGRWSIETTFQEMRACLGLETTRGWTESTVLRAAPCLFGLFSVIALWYAELPANQRREPTIHWPGKKDRTFSDAITAVRRWLWLHWVFATPGHHQAFSKLSRPLKAVLLYALAPAA
jgi:hypothetical protein